MRPHPNANSFSAAWWLFHALVITGMCVCGFVLGQWLTAIIMQPVIQGDISAEWWQIFQKFAATLIGTMFLAPVIGYVVLILPDQG